MITLRFYITSKFFSLFAEGGEMKPLHVFPLFLILALALGCSEKSSQFLTSSANQLNGIDLEPDPYLYNVISTSNITLPGNDIVVLDQNLAGAETEQEDSKNAWIPMTKNGKTNLVWWSNWENAPEVIDHQIRVSWSDDDGNMHQAWVTPVRWDGVEPGICRPKPYNYDDPPIIFALRSMAEYLAWRASNHPGGKISLRNKFGENVQDWSAVWERAAEELSVHLPAAVKWTNHATDRATFEQLWGADFWSPEGDWDGWYPYLESENFGLD